MNRQCFCVLSVVFLAALTAISEAAEKSADITLAIKDAAIVARPDAGGETATLGVDVAVKNTGSKRILLTRESLIYELREKGKDEPLMFFGLRDPRRVKAKAKAIVITPGKTDMIHVELSIHTIILDTDTEYGLTVKGQVFDGKATQKVKFK